MYLHHNLRNLRAVDPSKKNKKGTGEAHCYRERPTIRVRLLEWMHLKRVLEGDDGMWTNVGRSTSEDPEQDDGVLHIFGKVLDSSVSAQPQ